MNFLSIFKNLMNKIKPKPQKLESQEQIVLTFFKGRDSRTISRSQAGKICLLDIPYCKQNNIYVKEYEDWRCAVKVEKEHCIVVQPITRTLTAKENEEIMGESLGKLKTKYNTKEKLRV